MNTQTGGYKQLQVGRLKLTILSSKAEAGVAAAEATAQAMRELLSLREDLSVIFATGASQLATLAALTKTPGIPWDRIRGFHLDEYVGLSESHPASFRRYLRENLTQLVHMKEFSEIDGNAGDLGRLCIEYAAKVLSSDPQICLLGIGENGHLAFNDPAEANFDDPLGAKVVRLDMVCREQQTAEGWFKTLDEVPNEAITLTIPTLFRVPKLIVSVPGKRKAHIVRRTLEEPISTNCPSTLLRSHPDATLYLDEESAAELGNLYQSG